MTTKTEQERQLLLAWRDEELDIILQMIREVVLKREYKSMGKIVLCDCGTWAEMKYYLILGTLRPDGYPSECFESDPEGICTSCGTEFLMLYDRILDFPKDVS